MAVDNLNFRIMFQTIVPGKYLRVESVAYSRLLFIQPFSLHQRRSSSEVYTPSDEVVRKF